MEEFFTFMDRDYDGILSFEEFMGEESTIERLFKSMDTVEYSTAHSQFPSNGLLKNNGGIYPSRQSVFHSES